MTAHEDRDALISLTSKLISIPSVTGNEAPVLEFLCEEFLRNDWGYEKIEVENNRYNLFISFGSPKICFTTHVDVVPAPESLFNPRVVEDEIWGRGACDAKGIASCMIQTAKRLLASGKSDFCLLFVVGEELGGLGARVAGKALQGRGIEYLVNGEPTEGKLITAHKGGVRFKIRTSGVSCHSGYPHLGDDANIKLIKIASRLLEADYGVDPVLGNSTINLGKIQAGTAPNIISDNAELMGYVRTVGDHQKVVETIEKCVLNEGEIIDLTVTPVAHLITVPDMDTGIAAYCTDIPHFSPLGTKNLLYGPGSINVAHTLVERVKISEMEEAVESYIKIYDYLVDVEKVK